MLTSFSQVAEWIKDNGFKRWVLYRDYARTEKILDSNSFPSDLNDKIAMTEKYLRLNGGHAYAAGAPSSATSDLNTVCEIQLDGRIQQLNSQGAAGVGMMDQQTIGELRRTIEEGLEAKWEKKMYEKEKKEFEEAKKQFEADRNGVIGAVVGYLAPYIPVLNQVTGMRKVAGVDTEAPVHAQPIIPDEETQEPEDIQEASAWDNFTDEEGEEIGRLMAEFKAIEPQYLELLRGVVKMAKGKNPLYSSAKDFILKA